MPFASKAQARLLFATEPKVAAEFAKKTPSIKALPEKVKSSGSSDWAAKHGHKFHRNAMKHSK